VSDLVSLGGGLRAAILQQESRSRDLDRAREAARIAMAEKGLSAERVNAVLNAFEAPYQTSLDTSFSPNRAAVEDALRSHVPASVLTSYVTALDQFRKANATSNHLQQQVYAIGGAAETRKLVEEAESLKTLRADIAEEARRINPNVDTETIYGLAGEDRGASEGYDPVRDTLSVSLDFSTFNPRHEMHRGLWMSLERLLNEKERGLLDDAFREAQAQGMDGEDFFQPGGATAAVDDQIGKSPWTDRQAWAARMYADWASPSLRQKPDSRLDRAFAPIARFFDRTRNFARGHGFTTVEDVWRKARSGVIAGRAAGETRAIRVPAADGLKQAARQSIAKMSGFELAKAIESQDVEIRAAREARLGKGVFKRGRTKRDERRKMEEMVRGRSMLLSAYRRAAQNGGRAEEPAPPSNGPEGPDQAPNGPSGPSPQPGGKGPLLRVIEGGKTESGRIDGAAGTYFYAEKEGYGNNYHLLQFQQAGQNRALDMGVFPNRETMAVYAEHLDRSRFGGGTVSSTAARLASAANSVSGQGNADVDMIRRSGLLDKDLDEVIGNKDVMAFAYPLKTGEMVWQDAHGEWRGGSLQDMTKDALQQRDGHLLNAAEAVAVRGNRPRGTATADRPDIARQTAPGAPGPAMPGQTAPGQRPAHVFRWLDVPPEEIGTAAIKGAQYDNVMGRWYAPDKQIADATKKWHRTERAEPGPRAPEHRGVDTPRPPVHLRPENAPRNVPDAPPRPHPGASVPAADIDREQGTAPPPSPPPANDARFSAPQPVTEGGGVTEPPAGMQVSNEMKQDLLAGNASRVTENDLPAAHQFVSGQLAKMRIQDAAAADRAEVARQRIVLKRALTQIQNVMQEKGVALPKSASQASGKERGGQER